MATSQPKRPADVHGPHRRRHLAYSHPVFVGTVADGHGGGCSGDGCCCCGGGGGGGHGGRTRRVRPEGISPVLYDETHLTSEPK